MDDPRFVIQNWMRNRNTIEFLAVWETLHNPDFNRVQFEAVKNEAGLNRFVMTPTKWIEQMNAKGIVSKSVRWKCSICGHEWKQLIVTRVRSGKCPNCKGECNNKGKLE